MKIITAKEFCELITAVMNEQPRGSYWEKKITKSIEFRYDSSYENSSFVGYGAGSSCMETVEVEKIDYYINLAKLLTIKGYEPAIFPLSVADVKLIRENCVDQFLENTFNDELFSQLVWGLKISSSSQEPPIEFNLGSFKKILERIPLKYFDRLCKLDDIHRSFKDAIETENRKRKLDSKKEKTDTFKATTDVKVKKEKEKTALSKTNKNESTKSEKQKHQQKPTESVVKKSTAPADTNDDEHLSKQLQSKAQVDIYKGNIVRARDQKGGRQISMYGFPDKSKAERIEQKWQKGVITKFFKVGKPLKQGMKSYDIYKAIKDHIRHGKTTPIEIDGLSRRSFIIAMVKIMTKYGHMPELIFQLGITKIQLTHEKSYAQRQKGNFEMRLPALDEYQIAYGEGCINRLANFTTPDWDKSQYNQKKRKERFLKLIGERLNTMASFTHRDLNKYGNIYISSDTEYADRHDKQTQNNIHLLNGLIFLVTTVEVLVRLYRQPDGTVFPYSDQKGIQSDSFPVAIAQARSLVLLLSGEILFTDFLGETKKQGYDHVQHRAYYGAVTGKGTIDYPKTMLKKLCAINDLYNSIISSLPAWKMFNDTYAKSNDEGHVVEGRSRMYFDLREVYGSGAESDDETSDYSDTEDPELEEIVTYAP